MLELIFASAFIIILMIFATASLFVTEKVKDLANITTKPASYVVSFVITGLISYGTKILGVGAIFTLLLSLGYVGDIPDIPAEAMSNWIYFIVIHLGSWLVAGGFYDWRKLISKRSSALQLKA